MSSASTSESGALQEPFLGERSPPGTSEVARSCSAPEPRPQPSPPIPAPQAYNSVPHNSLLSAHSLGSDSALAHQEVTPGWLWEKRKQLRDHEFPGWGSMTSTSRSAVMAAKLAEQFSQRPYTPPAAVPATASDESNQCLLVRSPSYSSVVAPAHVKLGQLATTAICGNDIFSSVLYVCGLVTCTAGKAAPLCFLLVSFVLYLFRLVYGEAITAIPMNGGCYSVLINTTSKPVSAWAAALGVLSYLATGVMSATSACYYLRSVVPNAPDVIGLTVGLLLLFALLCVMGLSESATVATGIFVIHMLTLMVLCVTTSIYAVKNGGGEFWNNMNSAYPEVVVEKQVVAGSLMTALAFGYCDALLGVSGFETSSQFVQEQAPGVYLKSLRNMWVGVTIINPVISLLSLCVFTVPEVANKKETLLADMGTKVGEWMGEYGEVSMGTVLGTWVSLDAFMVLSGAVLTAYVGVNGLMKRLAMDRILPQILLQESWRGTNHILLFGFFVVASSLVVFLDGELEMLSGVYTLSFLGLMAFLAIGLMMLKFKRPDIPREVTCPWCVAFMALLMVSLGIIGNVLAQIDALAYFVIYFSVVLLCAFCMLNSATLLRLLLYACERTFPNTEFRCLTELIRCSKAFPNVFFAKYPDLSILNKAVLYVRENEQTADLTVVHCLDPEQSHEARAQTAARFQDGVALLDSIYPKIKINLLLLTDDQWAGVGQENFFNEAVIRLVSEMLKTPLNMMFIACPSSFKLDQYGGVRIITN